MSEQYQQVVATTDAQNNVTYIQFVNPQQQIVICKEEIDREYWDGDTEEVEEEMLEEDSYIDEDHIEEVEILESIVVEPRKTQARTSEQHQVTKKLVQVKGEDFVVRTLKSSY